MNTRKLKVGDPVWVWYGGRPMQAFVFETDTDYYGHRFPKRFKLKCKKPVFLGSFTNIAESKKDIIKHQIRYCKKFLEAFKQEIIDIQDQQIHWTERIKQLEKQLKGK